MRLKTLLTTVGLTAAALSLGLPGVAAAAPPAPGEVVISEVRFNGPGGAGDDYIELTNRTSTSQALNGSTICSAQNAGARSNVLATPMATIPANSAYIYRIASTTSSSLLGAGQTDATFSTGISEDRGVGLFTGTGTAATAETVCTAANRIDSFAIRFDGAASAVYTEETAEEPLGTTVPTSQLAYVRRYASGRPIDTSNNQKSGRPIDTNNNANDFVLVAAQEAPINQTATSNGVQPIFGTPGLQRNPVRPQGGAGLAVTRVDTSVPVGSSPNRTFEGTTLRLRRRITNNTGAAISNAKLRVVDITTNGAQAPDQVDLRLVTSTAAPEGTVNTALDTDAFTATIPTQGGLNSAVKIGAIAAGASVDIQMQFEVLDLTATNRRFSVTFIPEG